MMNITASKLQWKIGFIGMLFLLIAFAFVHAGPQKVHKKVKVKFRYTKGHYKYSRRVNQKSKKLRSKLSTLAERKAALRHMLALTKHKAKLAKVDLQTADSLLNQASIKLDGTKEELRDSEREQVALARALIVAKRKVATDKLAIEKRLRGSYEEGDSPLLAVMLGGRSSGDIASRGYVLERIAKEDKETLNRFKSTQNDYEAKKNRADQLVSRIEELEAARIADEQNYQQAREVKAQSLETLESQKSNLESMLQQFNRDESQIEQQIVDAERVQVYVKGRKIAYRVTQFEGEFIAPVHAPVTSSFGERYHPILHRERMHTGIDLGARYGTPIHAAASGTIIAAQRMGGYGNVVIINHGGGLATVYGHCSEILVSVGEQVSQGQVIARVGATGMATGPHLHFEIRVNGHPVNPENYVHL